MSKLLHCRLYDITKADLVAANVLTTNSLYPQAIYFYAQAFEKAAKSAVALYLARHENMSESKVSQELKDNYRHGLVKLTSFTAEIFVSGIKSYLERRGKESDKEILQAKNASSYLYLKS
jgi:hypothetical protein